MYKYFVVLSLVTVLTSLFIYYFSSSPNFSLERRGAKQMQTQNNATMRNDLKEKTEFENLGQAKELSGIVGYVNTTDGTTLQSILKKNKIVLFEFWTFECINCKRTLPYLNDWYSKYHDQGLEIVGVHTPEFAYEKNYDNVVQATKDLGVKFPVFMDNNYSTWNSYNNQYWPMRFLILPTGQIIYQHAGEGDYEQTENLIKQVLQNN